MSSTNTTVNAEIAKIRAGAAIVYQVWQWMLVALVVIGHTLNLYVLTRRTLRSNPCTRYFLASSISGLFVTLVNNPLRLLQIAFNLNAFETSNAACKALTYLVFCSRWVECIGDLQRNVLVLFTELWHHGLLSLLILTGRISFAESIGWLFLSSAYEYVCIISSSIVKYILVDF